MSPSLADLANPVVITPVDPQARPMHWTLMGFGRLTGGVGGWEVIDRPRQRAATEWTSTPPYRLVLPLSVSRVDYGGPGVDVSVEPEMRRLASWGQPVETGRPPILRVTGPVDQPAYGALWVIEDIELGDCIRMDDEQRTSQDFTLTLLEHTAAQVILGPTAAARARAGG